MSWDLARVMATYEGRNGEETRALYAALEALGPRGVIALNLFRAQKTSMRAKEYRRGSSRARSYETKSWSLGNLCEALAQHAGALGIAWGWSVDLEQPMHCHVLYVELGGRQVSFHNGTRLAGPDYAKGFDGAKGQSAQRILTWVAASFGRPVPLHGSGPVNVG